MSYEQGNRPPLTTEQIEALQASKDTLAALEACARPLIPQENDDLDDLDRMLLKHKMGDGFFQFQDQGRALRLYVQCIFENPSPHSYGPMSKETKHLLTEQKEDWQRELGGLTVCYRGMIEKSYDDTPKINQQYKIWQVKEDHPTLNGFAIIKRQEEEYYESFNEPSAELKTLLTERLTDMGGYNPHDPEEKPLFENIGGQDVIHVIGWEPKGTGAVLGRKEARNLTRVLFNAQINGQFKRKNSKT